MKGYVVALVVGMLASGSINTIAKKLGYGTCSSSPIAGTYTSSALCKDFTPNGHQFRKPWTQTLVMFTGEAMCLFLFFYKRSQAAARDKKRQSNGLVLDNHASNNGVTSPAYNFLSPTMARVSKINDDDLAKSDEAYKNVRWGSTLYCLLPACCDLGGTTVSGIGLLFTSASVFQMLRGSIIFFTAIFSVLFLNRKLQKFHWTGMGLTVVGVTMIGLSSILGASNNPTPEPLPPLSPSPSGDDFGGVGNVLWMFRNNTPANMVWIGNVLVVVSQLMSATQMVIEEKFLKSKQLPPEFVVGVEGTFGMIMMICITLPIVGMLPGQDGDGIHESAIDAAYLLSNSTPLMCMVLSYFVSIAFYNFCGLAVAKQLSSVHRCLIDACRTILVWSIDLALYYGTSGKYGEKWDPVGSWIQLAGFLVLIYGSCLYYKVIKLKCFEEQYDADERIDVNNVDGESPTVSLLGDQEDGRDFDSMYNELDG